MTRKAKTPVTDARNEGELTDGELDEVGGGAAFIKFDGVDGEVSTEGGGAHIEIESFSLGAGQTTTVRLPARKSCS